MKYINHDSTFSIFTTQITKPVKIKVIQPKCNVLLLCIPSLHQQVSLISVVEADMPMNFQGFVEDKKQPGHYNCLTAASYYIFLGYCNSTNEHITVGPTNPVGMNQTEIITQTKLQGRRQLLYGLLNAPHLLKLNSIIFVLSCHLCHATKSH